MAEQTLRPYNQTWADKLSSYLYDMTSKSPEARNFVGGLMGGTGLGRTQMGLVDATPLGVPLQMQESYQAGDAKGMALAALPMPVKAGAGMVKRAAEEAVARAPYQRKLSPQGLYSWGAESAYNLPQETMTVQQARSMLEKAGTKPDEFHWSGFHSAFPDPNAKVSRDALVSHFENNVPQLGETVLGGNQRVAAAQDAADRSLLDALEDRPTDYAGAQEAARVATNDARRQGYKPTKFGNYAIPGGDNYREVLTTLKPSAGNEFDPSRVRVEPKRLSTTQGSARLFYGDREIGTFDDPPMFNRETGAYETRSPDYWVDVVRRRFGGDRSLGIAPLDEGQTYRSAHWDEPNVLAHLRLSDRTDAGGNKVLHMEESQSDWGQDARKKGIKDTDNGLLEAATKEHEESKKVINNLYNKLASSGLSEQEIFDHPEIVAADAIQTAAAKKVGDINLRMRNGVPNAPYIGSTGNKSATGWTDLNLKRALWEAAQNDADRLAWTPGADQAARYDLSKQLDTLHYYPDTGELMGSQGGNTLMSKRVPKDKLADFVGKEVAERLLATEPTIVGNEAIHKLSGQDLSVGGEGMKAYYDRTIPTQLGAVMKRAGIEGGEMGTTQIFPDGIDLIDENTQPKTLPALGLTPAMREQIKKGLPYFGLAPVGFGMMPQDDNQR